MFPLRDLSERHSFPFINFALIAVNIFVFIQQVSAASFEDFTYTNAFVPAGFNFADPSSYFFILSSMFLHGSLLHILSNLWFLHIFGDNVEDRMGHIPYLIFYILSGFAAALAQYMVSADSIIPMVGASGAISGVSGAYFLLFRNSAIEAIVPTFGFWRTVQLPVWFFLGYWFLIQLLSGFGSLAGPDEGGVAFFAHIGGFVFGYIMANFFAASKKSTYS